MRMSRRVAYCKIVLLIIIAIAVPVVGSSQERSTRMWTFDHDSLKTLPPGFSVGTLFDGRPAGEWTVFETDRAQSPPHVLAQLMGKGAEHAYKTVLINELKASDLELQVSLLPIGGKADMGGGLIWRATDDRNYYLTRANPLEQNIRIYRVVKGVRLLLNNFDHIIDVRQWLPSASLRKVAGSKSSLTKSRCLICVTRLLPLAMSDFGRNPMPLPILMI